MAERELYLVAVDFEAASEKALALTQEIAQKLGGEVALVHVSQVPVYTYPGLEPAVLPTYSAEINRAATRALQDFAKGHGVERSFLREGDPATEILAAIEELKPKLCALGTHGRRGLSHLFLGSVAERVVRRSTAPILTVRSDG